MKCDKCGTELTDGAVCVCATTEGNNKKLNDGACDCTTTQVETKKKDNGDCAATETVAKKNAFSFDYRTVETNQKNAVEIVDCYEALGWEVANQHDGLSGVSLSFKRNRKIKNKDQLNRLQVKLDDHINGIDVFEKRKTQNATIASIAIGIIGTLIFGICMCLCMPDVFAPTPELWSYIVGGVLGAIGVSVCALAYPAYKRIRAKATITMNILIDKKRDEISRICEDAQKLLT